MAQSMRLIVSIVERGHGVAMQKLYTARQVFLHLQCAGRGTATSEIMDILGLGSSEKDVVLSFAPASACQSLLQELDSDLRGSTGTAGIVFSLPVSALNNLAAALVLFKAEQAKRNGGDTAMNHNEENTLILVACSRGHTDEVMSTAKEQGARGGTVIKAGASVKHCIVAENVRIEEGATVGAMPEGGLNIAEPGDVATVGSGVVVGKGATVGPKAMVSSDVKDGEEQW